MINEIKKIIQNYINNAKLCSLMTGTVTDSGIMINEKLTIPSELIKGNLKDFVAAGDEVRMIRNQGGKEFYISEIIGKPFVAKGAAVTLSLNGNKYEYTVEDVKR